MPQETNLNITPYFDDFLADNGAKKNNYYKVLFKPGYPVQARELTTLQSILQNQIEQFGNHIFKEGSVVIPGQLNYNDNFTAVEVEPEYLGIPLSQYVEDLVGKEIVGANSNIKAKISYVLGTESSPRGYYTIYVDYTSSGQNNQSVFQNGEVLTLVDSFVKGALVIQSGQGFSLTASTNASSTGSSVAVSEGVYFLRGTFVDVPDQLIVLDPYSNSPSYYVGFDIEEEIITPDDDENLNDNAQGFTNYAAPGADRFKIRAVLAKKDINEQLNESFIQLMEIRDGIVVSLARRTQYNAIRDELARRTYDESGDYYVTPFKVSVKESLNDYQGNNGAFKPGKTTYQNNIPSENLAIYQISPGKAYVKGYEVETVGDIMIDVPKTRDVKTLENQSISYLTGPTYRLNNVYGSPQLGLSTSYTVSLRDSRVGSSAISASGKEIGLARVYDFALESGSYSTSLPATNEWDISLYDIQPYTELFLNSNQTLSIPTQIVGKSSGAVAFLRTAVTSSGIVTAYDVKGKFIVGEQLIYNGRENTGITTGVTSYTLTDVQSIYGSGTSGYSTFSGDIKLSSFKNVGSVSITTSYVGTISTVRSTNYTFPTNVKVGDIVSYTTPGETLPTYSKVTSVTKNTLGITSTAGVTGVSTGILPTSIINVSDFKILGSQLLPSQDNTLYTKLPQKFVSSVDSSKSDLIIRKQYDASLSGGLMSPIVADTNETFLPFDEERYVLVLSNGSVQALTEDKIIISNGGKQLEMVGLSTGTFSGKLIATLRKINVKSKVKQKRRINSIVVDKSILPQSGVGATTLNDGLSYGTGGWPYGTRVQDQEICLLVPDVTQLYGVYESSGTGTPVLTKLTLTSLNGPTAQTDDLIIGEQFLTKTGECLGIYVSRIDANNIEIIKLNNNTISTGEIIVFSESGIEGLISDIIVGDTDISTNFDFFAGQEDSIYNYSKIIRKFDSRPPSKKIRIVFESAYYSDSDDGDITTVSSYDQFNYKDIPLADFETSCSDLIDIRPRVSLYNSSEGARSPFEFLGRTYASSSNSAKNVLASDESFSITYSYYLPRIDRIYLTKDNGFRVVKGDPADNPTPPIPVSDSLEIARISLPPYLGDVGKAVIDITEHKRYRMSDIARLEDRLFNLEYYTTLSLLETKTESLFVPDENGLNRFKSGFFVDNFTDVRPQILTEQPRNSIDVSVQELRPSHYTTQLDLQLGSKSIIGLGSTSDPTVDTRFLEDIIGSNIKKTGQLLTLDYSNSVYLNQPFATRAIPVTPYLITSYNGTVELNPSSDIWIDTQRQKTQTVNIDLYSPINSVLQWTLPGYNPANGLGPITWGSWNTTWTGSQASSQRVNVARNGINEVTTTVTTTKQQRSGTRLDLNPTTTRQDLGDRVVSSTVINFMRSRNIEFIAKRFRPFTQIFPYFDSIEVDGYCFPKLVQIDMVSGVFSRGETVVGNIGSVAAVPNNRVSPRPQARFRICNPNHKYGRITRPSDVFTTDPYTRTGLIPSTYSSTSTILNVDTFSMSEKANDQLYGLIIPGMRLKGLRSGAEAVVREVTLVTDEVGTVIGSFLIPNPNESTSPKFETGIKIFKLTSSPTNSSTDIISSGQEQYFAQGTLNQVQKTVVSTRAPRFDIDTVKQNRTLTSTSTSTRVIRPPDPPPRRRHDPLAQSFRVDEPSGIFVTKVDLFLKDKDPVIPLVVQLRTMDNGVPTTDIYPFGEVVLDSANVNVSAAGTVATSVTFPSPVYLKGDTEHAIVLMSDSSQYFAWCSRLGEIDITTQGGPESRQIVVTTQPTLGSLFKSQNGSTWDASQYEDLKFTLYSADFEVNNLGTVNFFNPNLGIGNDQIRNLTPDPIEFISSTVRVGISSSITDNIFALGNTIVQGGSGATGKYVGVAGSATGTLTITNAGIGYTPTDGSSYTFTNVVLSSVTGRGRNATADITIGASGGVNGIAIGATIVSGGSGYNIGDVLTATKIGNLTLGRNVRFTVAQLGYKNELLIDQVLGSFITGTGSTIRYINNLGVTTDLNGIVGGGITAVSVVQDNEVTDGYHIKINHRNHGMHSRTNEVILSGIGADSNPVRLSTDYSSSSSSDISLSDSTIFTTFEGIGIGTTTKGYALIDNEIISYTGVSGNTLTGITRGIDNTIPNSYGSGSLVYKYENNGVSLRRINKTHTLDDAQAINSIGLDHYYLKLDMSGRDLATSNELIDRTSTQSFPRLYINQTKSSGGAAVYATQNIPYEMVHPQIQVLSLPGTEVSASVRTVSGTSISNSSEISFLDNGFESISLNQDNYLSSPRIVCSKVNEDGKLDTLPGNRSFELSVSLGSENTKISPVIDLDRIGCIFTTNRVNSVITGFTTDSRVNTIINDPSAFTYAIQPVELELPATSIRIILSAYINNEADLRALYAIGNKPEETSVYNLFPGYDNLDTSGFVVDASKNSGLSNKKIQKVNEYQSDSSRLPFKEYEFFIDNLTPFRFYSIKLIGTSTNQAYPPRVRDLRVIAFA